MNEYSFTGQLLCCIQKVFVSCSVFLITVLQIACMVLAITALVFTPRECYNQLISYEMELLLLEILLSTVKQMYKHPIWNTVLLMIVAFTAHDTFLLITLDELLGILFPQSLSDWFTVGALALLHIGEMFYIKKLLPNKSLIPVCNNALTVSFVLSTALLWKCGLLSVSLSLPLTIGAVLLAISSVFFAYSDFKTVLHQHLIEKHKDNAELTAILDSYHDGSVFVPYPVTSQAIEDLIERRVLTLRNPKAAKLNPHGAWYDLSKKHYDDLCKPAQEKPQE